MPQPDEKDQRRIMINLHFVVALWRCVRVLLYLFLKCMTSRVLFIFGTTTKVRHYRKYRIIFSLVCCLASEEGTKQQQKKIQQHFSPP